MYNFKQKNASYGQNQPHGHYSELNGMESYAFIDYEKNEQATGFCALLKNLGVKEDELNLFMEIVQLLRKVWEVLMSYDYLSQERINEFENNVNTLVAKWKKSVFSVTPSKYSRSKFC